MRGTGAVQPESARSGAGRCGNSAAILQPKGSTEADFHASILVGCHGCSQLRLVPPSRANERVVGADSQRSAESTVSAPVSNSGPP